VVAVFGHRGACGYLPENTVESFLLAFEQGAEAIELDILPTRDGELLVRHEGNLALSTDIAGRFEFAPFQRDGIADGYESFGFFVEDFDRDLLRALRARERFSQLRPESASHDGRFTIPTMRELLADDRFAGRHLIIELKHARHYQQLGLDTVALLAEQVYASGFLDHGRITLESFDFEICEQLGAAIPEAEVMFLTMRARLPEGEVRPSRELLERAAEKFDGICVEVEMSFERGSGVHPLNERIWVLDFDRPTGLIQEIQSLGVKCYIFTARSEFAIGSVDDYYRALVRSGANGIFGDQPDQLLKIVSELA
jgi:glycerophosphoryl diester phosphodiesterase